MLSSQFTLQVWLLWRVLAWPCLGQWKWYTSLGHLDFSSDFVWRRCRCSTWVLPQAQVYLMCPTLWVLRAPSSPWSSHTAAVSSRCNTCDSKMKHAYRVVDILLQSAVIHFCNGHWITPNFDNSIYFWSGRDLVNMAKKRPNIVPIIEDARHPQKYRMLVPMVDVIFADVAQPDQVRSPSWPLVSADCELLSAFDERLFV